MPLSLSSQHSSISLDSWSIDHQVLDDVKQDRNITERGNISIFFFFYISND